MAIALKKLMAISRSLWSSMKLKNCQVRDKWDDRYEIYATGTRTTSRCTRQVGEVSCNKWSWKKRGTAERQVRSRSAFLTLCILRRLSPSLYTRDINAFSINSFRRARRHPGARDSCILQGCNRVTRVRVTINWTDVVSAPICSGSFCNRSFVSAIAFSSSRDVAMYYQDLTHG